MGKKKNLILTDFLRIDKIDDQYIILPKDSVTVKLNVYDYVGNLKITWTVFSDLPFSGTITQDDFRLTATFSGFKEPGIYNVQVNVKDDRDFIVAGFFRIIVNSHNLIANAGIDKVLQLPITSLTLTGTYIGGIPPHTFKWEQLPSKHLLTIKNGDKEKVTLSNFVTGVYNMKFSVTDNTDKTAFDVVQITVKEGLIIDAIPDQEITLPINSVKTTINVHNQTGDIDIKWTEMTGSYHFSGKITKHNLSTIFSGFTKEGVYLFEVYVIDGAGNTAVNTFRVIVNPEPLRVYAGEDQTITLPTDSVTTTATVNKKIEQITFISWNKTAGPNTFHIKQNTLDEEISDLIEGTYVFEIAVGDIYGQRATDSISIFVNASVETKRQRKAAADKKAKDDKAAADKKAKDDKAAADKKAKDDKAAADKKAKDDKAAADKKAKDDKAAAIRKKSSHKYNYLWKHNAKHNYNMFYDQKYPFIVEFVSLSENLTTKIWDYVEWITEAKQYDSNLNTFVDKRNITFNKGLFYNSRQSTGLLQFSNKDVSTHTVDYLSDRIIDGDADIVCIIKNEKEWSLNDLRDLRVNYLQPMFNSNIKDLQDEYYIDKTVNEKSIDLNKGWTESEPLRDKYLVIRLIFDDHNNINLLLNYSIEYNTQSFR